jgi:hypothetical protein
VTLKAAVCTTALVLVSLRCFSAAENQNQNGQPIQEQPGLKEGGGSISPEIVTDRPDITESGIVVPKGSLQAENGLTRATTANAPWTCLKLCCGWAWEAGPNCA